jgi:hypothetical protein
VAALSIPQGVRGLHHGCGQLLPLLAWKVVGK